MITVALCSVKGKRKLLQRADTRNSKSAVKFRFFFQFGITELYNKSLTC